MTHTNQPESDKPKTRIIGVPATGEEFIVGPEGVYKYKDAPTPKPSRQPDTELGLTREIDAIQRDIWRGINQEAEKRGIKLDIGDAYSLGSTIKETLHPRVKALLAAECQAARKERLEYKLKYVKERIKYKRAILGEGQHLDALISQSQRIKRQLEKMQ